MNISFKIQHKQYFGTGFKLLQEQCVPSRKVFLYLKIAFTSTELKIQTIAPSSGCNDTEQHDIHAKDVHLVVFKTIARLFHLNT